MKRFLINTSLFVSAIIISLIVGEILVRKSANPYSIKNDYITANAAFVSTIALGNSHTFYGIRTDMWPDTCVNLGNVSQTLTYDRLLIEHYLPKLPALKRIILQVSYTTLYDDEFEKSDEWWRCINYQLYMDTGRHSTLSKYNFELSNISVYSAKLGNIFGIGSPSLLCDSLGNGLGYTIANRSSAWEETGAAIARRHKESRDESRLPDNLAHLEAIADTCAAHGIDLVIYTQPEWITYRKNINAEHIKTISDTLNALCKRKNIKYINHYDDKRFAEADFYDADHLTYEHGAVKLTSFLINEIFKE